MLGFDQSLLINLLGHAAGALIFAIFLVLLFSRRGWSGARGRYLSGLAAALSLAWNAGSLAILVWPSMPASDARWVVAFSFSALSLIPAVLLHVSLGESRRGLVAAGYLLSAVAAGMHFREVQGGRQPAPGGAGRDYDRISGADRGGGGRPRLPGRRPAGGRAHCRLHVPGAVRHVLRALRRRPCQPGLVGGVVRPPRGHSAGPVSAAAGLPLRAAGRLRAVSGQCHAGGSAGVAGDPRRLPLRPGGARGHQPAARGGAAGQYLPAAGGLRLAAQPRPGVADARPVPPRRPGQSAPPGAGCARQFSDEEHYLEWAAAEIAAAGRTPASLRSIPAPKVRARAPDWAEATVAVRLGPGRDRRILLGRRQGGRRYLGEDLDALARAAAQIAEKLLALRRQRDGPPGQPGRTARPAIADQSALPVQRAQHALRHHPARRPPTRAAWC